MEPKSPSPPHANLNVAIVLADNFTLSAFSLFVDLIRLAADEGDGSRQRNACWAVLSEGRRSIRSSCGLAISASDNFGDPKQYDYIVVVGGLLRTENPISPEAEAFVLKGAQAGVTLVGLCTGTFILCRLGLMRGRRCCVSWYHHQDFLYEFPDHLAVADQLFVADGKRITCAGGAGTADLAAHLVDTHLGRSAAQKASQVLMFDRSRHGNESQPHPPLVTDAAKGKIARAMLLMEQNIASPVSIDALSGQLSMSKRALERLFHETAGKGAAAVYRDIRLRYASWLLATTKRSVTAIAQEAGFADCAHFSRLYKQRHGVSPTVHRQKGAETMGELAGPRVYS